MKPSYFNEIRKPHDPLHRYCHGNACGVAVKIFDLSTTNQHQDIEYKFAGFWDAVESCRARYRTPKSIVSLKKPDGSLLGGVIQQKQPSGYWCECDASMVGPDTLKEMNLVLL